MQNIYFSTTKSNYVILEVAKNQKIISDLSTSIKTDGKLEEILLKTYFKDLRYDLIGEMNNNLDYKKLKDTEIDSIEKILNHLDKNSIKLNSENKYYIFKEIKNG
ncbi:hypothetical protein HER18_05345 [Chryseobacterium sp. NEB161]|nr:hypothetical protein HER18_05345 [Chryseobacterium sp. NEB161]